MSVANLVVSGWGCAHMPDPAGTVVDPQLSGKAAAILRAASRGSLIPFAASELPRGACRPDDPDIAVVLGPQRRTHDLAVADAERQTRLLEAFAGQVQEADAAVRREDAIRRLATLNGSHADLLARIGRPGEDDQITDLTSHEAQAVIDRANEAVRKGNEAGRSLILPGAS